MTLEIDVSSAIRTLARYRELARAILDASPSTQETYWVEWKSEADIAQKRWQATFSRHILGFANRDPDEASKWLGGCGYVVAGVSPRSLTGTPVHDAARIEAWVSAYVGQGPNAPEWAPSYVELDGKSVLILTVEPPRVGHPIWTFQKDFPVPTESTDKTPYRAGSIFVRRKASTELASPTEIAMLSRRLVSASVVKRLGGLSLLVRPGSKAVALDLSEPVLKSWVEREENELKPPQEEPLSDGAAVAADPASPISQALAAFTASMFEPDSRTREDYQAEVGKYIVGATKALPAVLLRHAYERGMGRIDLAIRNDTDDPIHQLQVELYVAAQGVLAASEDVDIPDVSLPRRPVQFGKGGRSILGGLGLDQLGMVTGRGFPYASPAIRAIGRRVTIDNGGSARVTFAPVDLYPEQSYNLDDFQLLVNRAYAGQTLTGEWIARAKDASGVVRGTIAIEVDPDVPTVEELLAPASKDDQQTDGDV
ncbi:MAG: hypothetical protein ABSB75_01685 [Candidatus Limnocylindrales bacterium]